MALFPLKLPPGFSRPGTKYEAKGRWFNGTLVRWFEGIMQPIGGWQALQAGGSDITTGADGGVARGAHTWRGATDEPHLAIGTNTKLFVWISGALTDVTHASFTAGGKDAVQVSGVYGNGNYGDGPYGTGGSAATVLIEADTWQMENPVEDLICASFKDGLIYTQTGSATATLLGNAPTNVRGVVVTPEGFVVALGSGKIDGGNRRVVAWADVDDVTLWAPAPDNQAGELPLPGAGEILAGRRTRSETLIWTDVDLFAMRYIGGQFIYQIPQVGSNCGAISRRAMQVVDAQAIWMGHNGFFTYNGFVEDLPSTVGDFVFGDINRVQRSKIWAELKSAHGEITWYYPSTSSIECDKYVTFNYHQGIWYFGLLERTAGADQGALSTPIAMDAGGKVYEHELVGGTYLDPAASALVPFAESGPIEIGNGDQTLHIQEYIPDENTLGDLDVTIFGALLPLGPETESAVFNAAARTSTRILARQIRVKVTQNGTNWRLGTMRLNVVPSGQR